MAVNKSQIGKKGNVVKPNPWDKNNPTVVEIENIHLDVQDLAGLEPGGSDSYVSYAAERINIPEVKDAKAKFVYNYFTRDERVRKATRLSRDKILDVDVDYSDDILFQIRNDKMPRYVALQFSPPKTYGIIKKGTVKALIRDNLDKIFIEGATSNKYFTGIEFIDSGKEKEIYTLLKSSIFFTDIAAPKDSPKDAAEKLYESLEEKGGLFGQDKQLIKQAMSNMQSEGIRLAQTDIPPEIAEFANDPMSKQAFSIQFNNLVFSEIVNSAVRIPDSVFQDEFRAVVSHSKRVRNRLLRSIDPSSFSDANYEMTAKAVSIQSLSSIISPSAKKGFDDVQTATSSKSLYDKYPKIKLVGYMVQKYEINEDETVSFLGTLYSEDINGLYILDKNVRYGGAYIYKIRTICEVKTIVRKLSSSSSSLPTNELCVATLLVASEGANVDVICAESIPPPPPQNLRVGFNFRYKLPFLSWQFPLNVQRDIKRFQIFKRLSVEDPYKLIAEYDFDNSLIRGAVAEIALEENLYSLKKPSLNFLDKTYEMGQKPIYTLACVDAHGFSSNYSSQIQIEYNKYTNTIKTNIISLPDAPKPYPNLLLEMDAFEDAIRVSGYDRLRVFFDPEYYKVYKNVIRNSDSTKKSKNSEKVLRQKSLNFLRVNPSKETYKIHMINLDLQLDKIVGIKIADKSGSPSRSPVASFSKSNLSFEFGT